MNVSQYEVVDTLDRTITAISKNERIDRAKVLKSLQERLKHQQRRIDAFLAIGWVNGFEPIERLEGSERDGL
jgi:hypothetical protein